jgi:phage tail-like protein
MPQELDPGSTIYFDLTIDGQGLGRFNTCDGLSASVEIYQHQEGGNNGFVWQLPSRVTFSNITLTRPVTPETVKIGIWITSITTGVTRPTAQIAAKRADGSIVARWGLIEVLPVTWNGPSFNPATPAVATETLVIAHHGFTDAGAA